MWTFAATDPLVVAGLSALASALLLVAAWALNRLTNHDRDIAVLKREGELRDRDIAELDNRVRDLELQ